MFVERDARAAALIAENLAHCGVAKGCAIMRADLGRLPEPFGARRFDLILLDPPYAEPDLEAVVARAGRLARGRMACWCSSTRAVGRPPLPPET